MDVVHPLLGFFVLGWTQLQFEWIPYIMYTGEGSEKVELKLFKYSVTLSLSKPLTTA